MCTKTVHLEVVSDLSSQALLGALRRFICRCGCPSDISSDNSKNLTGLANQLKSLFDIFKSTPVQEYVASQFIRWHFILLYSHYFGGIWEAAVKQTMNQLLRACRAAVHNFEELQTLLCQVETCLNSRPLVPVSSDPSYVRVLTPGHFLIGSPLLEIPNSDHEGDLLLTSRWHLIQTIKQNFWKRSTRDYFHHLQRRARWIRLDPELQVGDLVVIHENTRPLLTWHKRNVPRIGWTCSSGSHSHSRWRYQTVNVTRLIIYI
ncbi:hypothetical protein AVEN_120084-1 [Araneus ventricosus]|uniref:DUF5641 domain-containing protein n=1 Tax=Araneus ventricosus TaxID=182803 RepID=A0A4Y2G204_ARAVE|nr:hypothetical protein AVEN_120084-1 [Araneus ventricosus]